MPAGVKGFQKGNTFGHNRLGTHNKLPAEVKEIIAKCFEDGLGGYQALVDWCKANPANLSTFYSKIWIRLLPMQLNVHAHKNVVYRSVQEVNQALGHRGLSLETIERLKKIDLRPDDVLDVTPNS